jgi:hypothetical protein
MGHAEKRGRSAYEEAIRMFSMQKIIIGVGSAVGGLGEPLASALKKVLL